MSDRDRLAEEYTTKERNNGRSETVSLSKLEVRAFKAGWDARDAEIAALVGALEKLTKFCPASDQHGKEEDCRVYGCKEGREALEKWRGEK